MSAGLICNLHVVDLGQHGHGRRRGVDAPLGFGGRHALHAVHAALVLEPRVGALARDLKDHLFEPAHAGVVEAEHVGLPLFAFGIAGVHAIQVGGKDAGLVAAGPGPDLDDDVLLVVGILGQEQEPHLGVQRLHLRLQARDLRLGHLAHLRIVFHLHQLARIGQFLLQGS